MHSNEQNLQTDNSESNHAALAAEIDWFYQLIQCKVAVAMNLPEGKNCQAPPPPGLSQSASVYAAMVRENRLGMTERMALAALLAAELRPSIWTKVAGSTEGYPEIGLLPGIVRNHFHLTTRTLMFLCSSAGLAGLDAAHEIFSPAHPFMRGRMIELHRPQGGLSFSDHRVTLRREFLRYLLTGKQTRPDFSPDFPAHFLNTQLGWDDLVLPSKTMVQVSEILIWLRHGKGIYEDWAMGRHLKRGFRALFHGPPGTGKTLTAQLLGKEAGRDVYRVDLSQVVSKYIGETEKNLARLFDEAEGKDWILFFDEADSIFGKRGKVSDARDRYANQEVSYLLQRVEDFDGLVILASNQKTNLDEAFSRRFQSIIEFPLPDPQQRLRLWQNILPKACELEESFDLEVIANKFELAGGSILNIAGYVVLMARSRGDALIRGNDMVEGIRREYRKSGKMI